MFFAKTFLRTAVPNWRPGDTIPVRRGWTLRVIATRLDKEEPVLVVEAA
jgi:hypothetical protein